MMEVSFAWRGESSEFWRRLGDRTWVNGKAERIERGKMDYRMVEVLHTGVGEKVCRQRVANFLRGQQFDLLISTGFAGALNDQLQVGDLLLAKNFSTVELTEVSSS